MRIRFSILRKFIFAFLTLSLLPLCVLGFYTSYSLWRIGDRAIASSTSQLERRGLETLELRAVELADRVSLFLRDCEADLFTLQVLPRDSHSYQSFSLAHRRTIWTREGTNGNYVEVHRNIPLYREIAFIDARGREQIRIVDDRIVAPTRLRDVSDPRNTTYGSERYFGETARLKAGQIYVSHVTGWYVTREEQLQGETDVEKAVEGKKYEGVVRFATPLLDESGQFLGMFMLSLDHRHLMELTQHVLPTEERFVSFPSYTSGNYAFMFDDEGWMISHPKFWDIRGVRPDGTEFDPTAAYYTREQMQAGKVPYHLDHVGFINPNYPVIAREVRAGRAGVTRTFNVGGTPRVMAYAPIFYDRGPYSRYGVFGGITIGLQTQKFMEPAVLARSQIASMVNRTKQSSVVILGGTALAAILLAFVLARTFTRPILLLSDKTREIAAGQTPQDVAVHTGDEIEVLSHNFMRMASQIREHREHLEYSLSALAESKKSVEQYTQELEKQVRILKNVHYLSQYLGNVFDREQVLQTVLKTCVEGLDFDRAILYLYDHRSRRLICRYTYGFSEEHERRAKNGSYDIDRHDCAPTRVFRQGQTMFVNDIHTDQTATPLDIRICEIGELDSFVLTPIKSRDRVIGVLGADTANNPRTISSIEVESLQIVANDAARAIERSELYRHLMAERDFVQSIFSNMTTGIITLDEARRVTSLNPYSERVFNISQQETLGRHYREVFRDYSSWTGLIDERLLADENGKQALEHLLVFPDGQSKSLEVQFSKIRHGERKHTVYLLFVRDITSRKQLEEHIRRSDRLISLGVLAAGIAHEMRNPLTGISLLLDDLHDHLNDGRHSREMMKRALQEIDRLENLITGLLDFAAPSEPVQLIEHSVGDVLQKMVFFIKKQCKNQRVKLTVDIEESLPEVRLDPERLQQALLNVSLNAIQAMPDGGSVTLTVHRVGADESLPALPAVRIAVKDTGRGIAAEDIPYIFDPFFSRHPGGCGLGLSIVHSIIEEHGGRISVSSRLGGGTSFWIDLPIAASRTAKAVQGDG